MKKMLVEASGLIFTELKKMNFQQRFNLEVV